MPGALSTLAFVTAAFRGGWLKERIHSDGSTSPLSATTASNSAVGRRDAVCLCAGPARPERPDLYSSAEALLPISRQTRPAIKARLPHYFSKVWLSSVTLRPLTASILVRVAPLQLQRKRLLSNDFITPAKSYNK